MYDFVDAASQNPTFYADLTNPQSLNKYQYTYNDPLNLVDPDGHCPTCPFDPQATTRVYNAFKDLGNKALDVVQTGLSAVGLVPAAGETADVTNAVISVGRGNYVEAGIDGLGALGPAGSAVALGNRVRKLGKLASRGHDAVEAGADISTSFSKGITATKAENLRKADAKGIPASQLGPSGQPKIKKVSLPTRKRAENYTQARSSGPLAKDVNPTKGNTHYHPTRKDGSRKKGNQNVHVEVGSKKGRLPD